MAILNNVPTLSYISWKNMLITYDEQTYQITNDYTMKPYIYWDYNNPYVLISSNEMLKELAGRFYIIFNDSFRPCFNNVFIKLWRPYIRRRTNKYT